MGSPGNYVAHPRSPTASSDGAYRRAFGPAVATPAERQIRSRLSYRPRPSSRPLPRAHPPCPVRTPGHPSFRDPRHAVTPYAFLSNKPALTRTPVCLQSMHRGRHGPASHPSASACPHTPLQPNKVLSSKGLHPSAPACVASGWTGSGRGDRRGEVGQGRDWEFGARD